MKVLTLLSRLLDFGACQSPDQRLRRPFPANSQCAKILAALEKGQRMTALSAFILCNATSADRRLREVAKYVAGQGRTLHSQWIKTKGGARVKEFWLADPQNDRRKRLRGNQKINTKA